MMAAITIREIQKNQHRYLWSLEFFIVRECPLCWGEPLGAASASFGPSPYCLGLRIDNSNQMVLQPEASSGCGLDETISMPTWQEAGSSRKDVQISTHWINNCHVQPCANPSSTSADTPKAAICKPAFTSQEWPQDSGSCG